MLEITRKSAILPAKRVADEGPELLLAALDSLVERLENSLQELDYFVLEDLAEGAEDFEDFFLH